MLKVIEKVGVAVVKNVALQNFGNDAEAEIGLLLVFI